MMRGIHAIAASEPERVALIVARGAGQDAVIRYGELERAINRAAHVIASLGTAPGDRVAVMLPNGPEIFSAWSAIARLGALVVPVSPRSAPPELAHLLADSEAKVLVHANAELAGRALAPLQGEIASVAIEELMSGDDSPPRSDYLGAPVSWMSYTSGTTGKPKGLERPPPRRLSSPPPNPYMQFWGFGANDVHLLCGPAYHTAPGAWAQMHLVEGAQLVIMPSWDASECLRAIAQHRVTNSHMVPANFIRILELDPEERARWDLTSVRKILHGAAACPPAVKRRIMRVFPRGSVWEYYGASEGMGTIISPEEWERKPGSVGRPFPGLGIRILDERGEIAPPHAIGSIYLKPAPGFEPAYKNEPEKTSAAYRDGYFTVGDLGWMDEDGYLYIADRRTDLILRGGVNIYPAEIEAALAEHPSVRDAAVFGVPDERLGQVVHAVVEPRSGAKIDADEIRAFLAERISDYKIPVTTEIVDRLPREPNGKIRKQALGERVFRPSRD
jgi:long-chain acyl-CoA synthetase